MASMLIMNTYITIFIAYLDADQQRRSRYPISIYHLCSVPHTRKTEAVFQRARMNLTISPGPFDFIKCTECQVLV